MFGLILQTHASRKLTYSCWERQHLHTLINRNNFKSTFRSLEAGSYSRSDSYPIEDRQPCNKCQKKAAFRRSKNLCLGWEMLIAGTEQCQRVTCFWRSFSRSSPLTYGQIPFLTSSPSVHLWTDGLSDYIFVQRLQVDVAYIDAAGKDRHTFLCAMKLHHIILVRSKLWIGEFLGKLWLPRPQPPKISQESLALARFVPHRIKVMLQCRLHGWGVKEWKRERCATSPNKGQEQICRVLFCFVSRTEANELLRIDQTWQWSTFFLAWPVRPLEPGELIFLEPNAFTNRLEGATNAKDQNTCGHQLDTIFVFSV